MTNTTQNLNDIESLSFDEDDQQLFYIDDLRLKADALRHSVLPKLQLMTNHAIAEIHNIYEIDVFDDSHITKAPNFRKKRENKLTVDYDMVLCGLEGKRIKNKWFGAKRKDGKEPQIMPFKFTFCFSDKGLFTSLWMRPKMLTDETYHKYMVYILEESDRITNFCFYSNFKLNLPSLLNSTKENIEWMKSEKKYYHSYHSTIRSFPISSSDIKYLIEDYAIFYYLYQQYLTIAKGEKPKLDLLQKLYDWSQKASVEERNPKPDLDLNQIKEAAAQKVKVMPSLRWLVFQRDDWKCVSCGRSSHDNVILNMDHILPRSKGGPDRIDNLQTLCWECNIGKSNRDDTDLRY